jgi:hypothetical protein
LLLGVPGVEEDSSLASDVDNEPRFRLIASSPVIGVPLASRFSPRVFFSKLFSLGVSTFLTTLFVVDDDDDDNGGALAVDLIGVVGTDFDTSRGKRTSWMMSLNSLYRDWAHPYSW